MRVLLYLTLLTVFASTGLSACGYKGKLRTPAQIEKDEAEKAHKAQKRKEEEMRRTQ